MLYNPQIVDDLENNITTEIRTISNAVLDRVITNFSVRVVTVIQRQGAWIEYIVNYCAVLAKC